MSKIKRLLHLNCINHYASKPKLCLDDGVKSFSLQFSFLGPSIYDLKTDENRSYFLLMAQKAAHEMTYKKIKTSKATKLYLRDLQVHFAFHNDNFVYSYYPIKQYFCLPADNDTSRPLI